MYHQLKLQFFSLYIYNKDYTFALYIVMDLKYFMPALYAMMSL